MGDCEFDDACQDEEGFSTIVMKTLGVRFVGIGHACDLSDCDAGHFGKSPVFFQQFQGADVSFPVQLTFGSARWQLTPAMVRATLLVAGGERAMGN